MSLTQIVAGERVAQLSSNAQTKSFLAQPPFGALIRALAARRGALDTAAICRLLWITPVTLRNWERGGLPPATTMGWYARCLAVDAASLRCYRLQRMAALPARKERAA